MDEKPVDTENGVPDWWVENEDLREFLELPPYRPPRFQNDIYTHEIVPEIEQRYGCEIQFIGVNTEYLEDWEVRIDGEYKFSIGRRRDENGNTVYEIDSEEFQKKVETTMEHSVSADDGAH